jgi:hypothetical protein
MGQAQSLALDLSGLSRESHFSIQSGECDFADAVDEKRRSRAHAERSALLALHASDHEALRG